MIKISVVIPVYFNALNLPHLFPRLVDVAKKVPQFDFEFVFVDDGSQDSSYDVLCALAEQDSRVVLVKLSRNFGSFTAILAGLTHSSGDCAAILSADLQDPPELIIQMVDKWESGAQVVLAVREQRDESYFKRTLANIYYKLMQKYALPDMPGSGFDFVLIDRKIIDILTEIKEKNTSLMGLILWTGFKRSTLYYNREKREHGRSMWTLRKKLKYFVDSFVAFSYAPIRFMQYLGISIAFLGFLYSIFIAVRKLIYGFPVPGLSALIIITLIIGGVQLIMLGILGEYLWRNVDEAKRRPVFIVENILRKNSDMTNSQNHP